MIRSKEVIELFVDSILDIPICDAEKHIYKLFPDEDSRDAMLDELYRQLSRRRAGSGTPRGIYKFFVKAPRIHIKLSSKKGVGRVIYKDKIFEFPNSLEAFFFAEIIKSLGGEDVLTYHCASLYPVKTLIPNRVRPKVIRVTIGEDEFYE